MKHNKFLAIASVIAMFLLILDAETAISGMREAVTLCIYTIIPSVFPFLFVGGMLIQSISGNPSKNMMPFMKHLGIPRGSEILLVTGILGGYPIGAQCISQAVASGTLTKESGNRMLGFCCNAGPSFLFGILSPMFPSPVYAFWLWGIHLASAILIGIFLPPKSAEPASVTGNKTDTIPQILRNSITAIAQICGWILLFRVLIQFLENWILWRFPIEVRALLVGLLELSNGCIQLAQIESIQTQFLLAGILLSLGGLCVTMQTEAIVTNLDTKYYRIGKLMQASISSVLTVLLMPFLFPGNTDRTMVLCILVFSALSIPMLLIYIYRMEKKSSNSMTVAI